MSTTVTSRGLKYADPAARVLAAAFSNSIFVSYLLRTPESAWPTGEIPMDIIHSHFQKSLPEKAEWGAEISLSGSGAGDGDGDSWAAAAVWYVLVIYMSTYP